MSTTAAITRFAVGDTVNHVLADDKAGKGGRVIAVLNYGFVITVQWRDGATGTHEARYLTKA